ncbi:MAG: 4'-phosphopantetheinyl transferase family protein [Gemmatirosa sp.]
MSAPGPCVSVWRVDLDAPDVADLRSLLSDEELARSARFRRDQDSWRFVAARGALRALLGARLGEAPGRIRLAVDARGKPALHAAHGSTVQFNVAHTDGLALIALADGVAVGVDVERVRDAVAHELISAAGVLAPAERRSLLRLPPGSRPRAFFACWTRKEALLKGRGDGLATALSSFVVPVDPALPRMRVGGPVDGDEGWWLHTLRPAADFAAALAVAAPGARLACRAWPCGAASPSRGEAGAAASRRTHLAHGPATWSQSFPPS